MFKYLRNKKIDQNEIKIHIILAFKLFIKLKSYILCSNSKIIFFVTLEMFFFIVQKLLNLSISTTIKNISHCSTKQ